MNSYPLCANNEKNAKLALNVVKRNSVDLELALLIILLHSAMYLHRFGAHTCHYFITFSTKVGEISAVVKCYNSDLASIPVTFMNSTLI